MTSGSSEAEGEKAGLSHLAPARGTLLLEEHVALGGHIVDFHGWRLPLYYQGTGILAEHHAVRRGVGLFDVSHMGILTLSGESASKLLERRTPAAVKTMKANACRYTFFLDVDGKIIDDAVLSRLDSSVAPRDFLLVVNASMTDRIRDLLMQHRPVGTEIKGWNGQFGIVAVQGPGSQEMLQKEFGWDLSPLKFYTSSFFPLKGGQRVSFSRDLRQMAEDSVLVSRTGYTGELGFELFLPREDIVDFWRRLAKNGAIPCGLGARDTLRMEKGYLLSGVDFHQDRTPLEGGLDKFLSLDHMFVGREALQKLATQGDYPLWTGLLVSEKGFIPRSGAEIFHEGGVVGCVTSGGLSPTLGVGIALTFLPARLREPGTKLEIEVRGRRAPALPVPLPFVR